jgi:hypothetical protein
MPRNYIPEKELHPCACGCGELVTGTWKRGHARRGRQGEDTVVTPLSATEIDSDDGFEDLGEIPFVDVPDSPEPRRGGAEPEAASVPDGGGPRHARKDWRELPKVKHGPIKKIRITATIQADIHAKISMPLEIMGQIWAARDPLCGGRFLEQRPAIADAFTDIVIESADLVAFFTGPGGAFMKYLNLGAALWPVAEVVAAHHVYHTIELEAEPQPNPTSYAA